MPMETLDSRVATLERRFESLRREMDLLATNAPVADGWRGVVGSMAGFEDFGEVVRLGREWRQSFREPNEDGH